jgi:hypothetical protein
MVPTEQEEIYFVFMILNLYDSSQGFNELWVASYL